MAHILKIFKRLISNLGVNFSIDLHGMYLIVVMMIHKVLLQVY